VVQLAKFLIKAREPKEIQDFIADMKSNTRDALESSKRISTAYRKVRRGINEVHPAINDIYYVSDILLRLVMAFLGKWKDWNAERTEL
jgi:hypothetical protein